MLDIHSYSELILHPWGDDHNQTTDPNMNFRNPIYNGLRGTAGAGSYREFMPATDLDRFVLLGNNMRDKIDDERGRVYSVQQGMDLYPTTGTSEDYAYGRHFVDPSKRRITAFVLETGSEFQPTFTEGIRIIKEVSTGLINFCTNCLCVSEAAALMEHRFIEGEAGRRYADLFERHIGELIELTVADDKLLRDALATLQRVNTFIAADELGRNEPVSAKLVKSIDKLLGKYERKAGDPLKKALGRMRSDVKQFGGKTIDEGMMQLESTKEPA